MNLDEKRIRWEEGKSECVYELGSCYSIFIVFLFVFPFPTQPNGNGEREKSMRRSIGEG